jgi:YihY family inner membrane protein
MNVAERALRRLDSTQQRHIAPAFVFAIVKKFGDDDGGTLAALMTYYGFLSIFPLLLVLVTVLGRVLRGNPSLQHQIVTSSLKDFPVIGSQIRANIHALNGSAPSLAVGLLLLTWGGLGVAQAAQHAMAKVWNIPGRDRPAFLPRVGRAVLTLAVLLLAVLATTVIAGAATSVGTSRVVSMLTIVATTALNVLLYALAFRILTPKPIATRSLWPGAIAGGVLWTALQALSGWLVARQLRHTSELYGFFAIVLGLMAFLFLAARLMVYAAELNVVLARRLWPRSIVQPPLTSADQRVLTDLAKAETRQPGQEVTVEFNEVGAGRSKGTSET